MSDGFAMLVGACIGDVIRNLRECPVPASRAPTLHGRSCNPYLPAPTTGQIHPVVDVGDRGLWHGGSLPDDRLGPRG
jgi:hypothetical protein